MDIKCPNCSKTVVLFNRKKNSTTSCQCDIVISERTAWEIEPKQTKLEKLLADKAISEALLPEGEDLERQKDEVFVMKNLYTEEFSLHNDRDSPPYLGCIKISPLLPDDKLIINLETSQDGKKVVYQCAIKYAAPVELYFCLTKNYPSNSKPLYSVRCIWLPDDKLRELCKHLDKIWDDNFGYEILYSWSTFLRSDLATALSLSKEFTYATNVQGVEGDVKTVITGGEKDAIVVKNNPITYKGYQKEKLPSETESQKKKKSKGKCKRKYATEEVGCVQIGNSIKYMFPGDANQRYKFETIRETERKLKTAVVIDTQKVEYSIIGEETTSILDEKPNEDWSKVDRVYETLVGSSENCSVNMQAVSSESVNVKTKIDVIEAYNTAEFEKTYQECEVCYEMKLGASCVLLRPCCHIFCKTCVESYIKVCLDDNRVCDVRCLMTDCSSNLVQDVIKTIITEDLFNKYKKQKLQNVLDNHKNLLYCPRQFCQNIAYVCGEESDPFGHCRQCQYHFCIYCKKAYHGVEVCDLHNEEIRNVVDEYENGNAQRKRELEKIYSKKQLKEWVENELSERWKREMGKKCPTCKSVIEKWTGCNKMRCAKCNTFFCWLCNKKLDSEYPYEHFKLPGTECYNMLFGLGPGNEDGILEDEVYYEDEDVFLEFDEEDEMLEHIYFNDLVI